MATPPASSLAAEQPANGSKVALVLEAEPLPLSTPQGPLRVPWR